MNKDLYLGYSDSELAESPYALFFKPEVAPLSAEAREAILMGPLAAEMFPGLEEANRLIQDKGGKVGTGFTVTDQGETRVFDTTAMPNVTPAMWDWWFAWHGDDAQKYKLWHPRAHVDVTWADGKGNIGAYLGRTSQVVEYIGARRLRGSIRFVAPSDLGIDQNALTGNGEVCICGRIGPVSPKIDAGWLVHHIFPIAGGSEMRSYFWLGGPHISSRSGNPLATSAIRAAAKVAPAATNVPAAELLVHCAQEMSHLASILPEIYAEFCGTAQEAAE